MSASAARLLERWADHLEAAGLTDPGAATGRRIIARYGRPHRVYHGRGHLAFLLGEIERMAGLVGDLARLRFAAWFHDAIYASWRKDNELRSALWAEMALRAMGADAALADRTGALIRATARHGEGGRDGDDDLFLDMDMSILGAAPEVYDRYARQVRLEYFWAPPQAYRKGRRAFLEAVLGRRRIFLTDTYESALGAQARENLRRELSGL
ncbi:N-methyl-D-aspartate receptor NMDAR2C subunit [Marinicauda algicola]|uniref:N-methyl-D-aspartate receptor NMDAR2C subunit n=1 Tax=Marinicauda algicola TaxID=2029849 RepID=A0A4V3RXZ3_9PROT|nr:N-methyl-D-aspartate receptor NMDAR2C subunit [Marinicauda algicola]TGY88349.1 N-methyl-D-aspartate receptor NMDAR2C subunit [Marinicauda algicola]